MGPSLRRNLIAADFSSCETAVVCSLSARHDYRADKQTFRRDEVDDGGAHCFAAADSCGSLGFVTKSAFEHNRETSHRNRFAVVYGTAASIANETAPGEGPRCLLACAGR